MLGKMRPKYRRQNENQRADKSKIPKLKAPRRKSMTAIIAIKTSADPRSFERRTHPTIIPA